MRMVTPPRIRRFLGLVALAALTAMGASGAEARRQSTQAQAGPIPTGAISGVVVDATTGRPVADAAVRLSRVDSSSFPTVARVTTDARGRFVFRNLPAAPNYALGAGASRFGYLYTSYGSTSPGGAIIFNDVTRIALADEQWINTITIPLWRQPTVTGRVTDERGEPVVGIAVRAFSVLVAGQPQWVSGPIAVTDDRGAYRITGLDPGNYVVSVLSVQTTVLDTTTEVAPRRAIGELESGGYRPQRHGVLMTPAIDVDGKHRLAITYFAAPPPPSGDSARAYPAMFYPTATTIAAADLIPLGCGDSKADVDFSLRPVPTFRVSGRLDTRGAMPPPFLLRLMPQGSERLGPRLRGGDVDRRARRSVHIPQRAGRRVHAARAGRHHGLLEWKRHGLARHGAGVQPGRPVRGIDVRHAGPEQPVAKRKDGARLGPCAGHRRRTERDEHRRAAPSGREAAGAHRFSGNNEADSGSAADHGGACQR